MEFLVKKSNGEFEKFNARKFVITSWQIFPAEIKTNYVEIPFRNGSLDLTETLTGAVNFGNEECSINMACKGSIEENRKAVDNLIRAIHGRRCQFELPDGKIRTGRMQVIPGEPSRAWEVELKGILDVYS